MALLRLVIVALTLGVASAMPAAAGPQIQRGESLNHFGLAITLPAKWDGRIYWRHMGLPVLHAGNFRLPRGDDDVGTEAIKKMRKGSVFIVLLETGIGGAHFPRLVGHPRVVRSDFLPRFEGVPDSHAFARVLFSTKSRHFQLWVQFGVRPASDPLLQEANRVLTTLTVARSRSTRH